MFFDLFQPAKDAWGCAFCVGTGFMVRRDLLDRLGGFPEGAVSEDIYLTYGLMRHGYETRWLNERLSIGLSAEDIAEYCTQRARWCLGTIQVALLPDGPMRGPGYTLNQRLHYLHGLLHWLSKPFLPLLLIGPAIYWVFGVPAFQTDHVDFVRYGVPALVCFWLHSAWISRGRSLPIFTEAAHAVAALPVSIALASALLRPFGRPFKVTAKGSSRTAMRFNRNFALGFGAIIVANLGGITWSLLGPDQPVEVPAEDLMNIVWASIAIILAIVCLLVCCELPCPRSEERFEVNRPTRIRLERQPGPLREGATLCDISAGGARIALPHGLPPPVVGSLIWCEFPELDPLRGRVVRIGQGGMLGLAWEMEPRERRRLIAALFSQAPENIAGTGDLRRALAGLWGRVRNPDGRR